MRPPILFPLFAAITELPGLGVRLSRLIERLAGGRVIDLCWHLPTHLIDRSYQPQLHEAHAAVKREGALIATLCATVQAHHPSPARNRPYRVTLNDGTGLVDLVFFNPRPSYLLDQLPIGQERLVSGRLEFYAEKLQMVHPDHIIIPTAAETLPRTEPIYALTTGLTNRVFIKPMAAALQKLPKLPEWNDRHLLQRENWPDWHTALCTAHKLPQGLADLTPFSAVRRRLAYDELLANQLALMLVRTHRLRKTGCSNQGDGRLRAAVIAALPFTLTKAQQQAIAIIADDMAKPEQMVRMLQGDVGSGKTLVALIAILVAVEAGGQAALMAPTEILARQHFATLQPLIAVCDVPIALLTGRDKPADRKPILSGLANGQIKVVIGTHALIQDQVRFADLRLAVIDEQHRFGVEQRLALLAKGSSRAAPEYSLSNQNQSSTLTKSTGTDMLAMSATPIPRSLMLAAYGDIDVTLLPEKPAGRGKIDTRTIPVSRLEEVMQAVGRVLNRGDKVFWVCPLVTESEKSDLAATEQRFATLNTLFPGQVVLAHGRMKTSEKQAAMAAFIGQTGLTAVNLLVATTVIEVGVDVPAATIMVIEGAERFGLAQLHQLRGRIGRGNQAGTCLLVYGASLTTTARQRLQVLRESDDGFFIAEQDLILRGGGALLGTKQSGLPQFRLADLTAHHDLLALAQSDAKIVCTKDPNLITERGAALRILLYLFERDHAIASLRSG